MTRLKRIIIKMMRLVSLMNLHPLI